MFLLNLYYFQVYWMLWIDCKMKIGISLMSCLEVHDELEWFSSVAGMMLPWWELLLPWHLLAYFDRSSLEEGLCFLADWKSVILSFPKMCYFFIEKYSNFQRIVITKCQERKYLVFFLVQLFEHSKIFLACFIKEEKTEHHFSSFLNK